MGRPRPCLQHPLTGAVVDHSGPFDHRVARRTGLQSLAIRLIMGAFARKNSRLSAAATQPGCF